MKMVYKLWKRIFLCPKHKYGRAAGTRVQREIRQRQETGAVAPQHFKDASLPAVQVAVESGDLCVYMQMSSLTLLSY